MTKRPTFIPMKDFILFADIKYQKRILIDTNLEKNLKSTDFTHFHGILYF